MNILCEYIFIQVSKDLKWLIEYSMNRDKPSFSKDVLVPSSNQEDGNEDPSRYGMSHWIKDHSSPLIPVSDEDPETRDPTKEVNYSVELKMTMTYNGELDNLRPNDLLMFFRKSQSGRRIDINLISILLFFGYGTLSPKGKLLGVEKLSSDVIINFSLKDFPGISKNRWDLVFNLRHIGRRGSLNCTLDFTPLFMNAPDLLAKTGPHFRSYDEKRPIVEQNENGFWVITDITPS